MTRLGVARPGKNFCDTLPLSFSAISEKSLNDDLFRNAWMAWQSKHRNSIMKGRLVHLLRFVTPEAGRRSSARPIQLGATRRGNCETMLGNQRCWKFDETHSHNRASMGYLGMSAYHHVY